MRGYSSLKEEFLKKWAKGLQVCSSSSKKMAIYERKKAIKLSADIAMASTRNGKTCWSRTVIANATRNNDNYRILVERMLGTGRLPECESTALKKKSAASRVSVMRKKILKKSRRVSSSGRALSMRKRDVVKTNSIARRLVKKKTQVLKSLVPGGELLEDERSLIAETLDYIISLRAQVDAMRSLATTSELINST